MKAEINYLGLTIEVSQAEYTFYKLFRKNGKPKDVTFFKGFKFVMDTSAASLRFLEEFLKIDKQFQNSNEADPTPAEIFKPFTIKVYDTSGYKIRELELIDAHIKNYEEVFQAFQNQKGDENMSITTEIEVVSAIQRINKKALNVYQWRYSDYTIPEHQSPVNAVEEKEKQPFRIDIKAKNSDIKNGVFGFDTIPDEGIVVSNYDKLKKEYKPLSEKILNEEYIPSWLSIRKGQTVELELDWKKKSRANEYSKIAFDTHPDFTITPANLKDASKVQITCNNTNAQPAQLLIKADNTTVGALNIFYPTPKSIDLEWYFVEITGNDKDKDQLINKIHKIKLENSLKKGLNPALIDVNIINEEAAIVDITKYTERLKESELLKTHYVAGNYIERSKKNVTLGYISNSAANDVNKITAYFINQKCINEKDIDSNGIYKMAGGISPTGKGIAYLVLDDAESIKSENIIHEVMHALGLKHTFESNHKFKERETDNYMDYLNTKKHTYKWQWQQLQEYSKLN